VCTPVWTDHAYYDVCARDVLRGAALERDFVFMTPPGMVWALVAVRSLLGPGIIAARLADLAIVTAVVALLVWWLRVVGLSRAARVWSAVALFAFYLTTNEWSHVQPDVWMLLPALVALHLRRRQVAALSGAGSPGRRVASWALLEGVCWGAGCLIKPYVVVPGLLAWLASVALVYRSGPGRLGPLARDAAGLLAGGLLMGAAWQGWLLVEGTWGSFWRNYAEFRRDYFAYNLSWSVAVQAFLFKLLPWGLIHVLAIPVALWALLRAALQRRPRPRPGLVEEPLLAGLYLGWLFQASFLQHQFDYHLVPAVLLAITLLFGSWCRPAGRAWGRLALAAVVVVGVLCEPSLPPARRDRGAVPDDRLEAGVFWRPTLRPARLALWGRCWREGNTPEMKDRLATVPFGPNWVELGRVTDYLRAQDLHDGDLLCYEATALAVDEELGLRLPTRFPHPTTALAQYVAHRTALRRELQAGPQRYILTDMASWEEPHLAPAQAEAERPGDPLALPPDFPPHLTGVWPFTEPVVFRAGRYYVHRATRPAQP
jgi:hypothetical protein